MNRPSFAQAVGSAAMLSALSNAWPRSESENATPGKIMAVAAHPGDGLFTMVALLAQQAERGAAAVLVNLSPGERGAPKNTPVNQYGEIQRTASEKAARLLGINALFLDYPDSEIPFNEAGTLRVCDAIRFFFGTTITTAAFRSCAGVFPDLNLPSRRFHFFNKNSGVRVHSSHCFLHPFFNRKELAPPLLAFQDRNVPIDGEPGKALRAFGE